MIWFRVRACWAVAEGFVCWQGQVDSLSEMWAAAKADAANGGGGGSEANGVQQEGGDNEKRGSWLGGWLGGGGGSGDEGGDKAATPPRPVAGSSPKGWEQEELLKQVEALEKHVDVLEKDLRSGRDALGVLCLCRFRCLWLWLCVSISVSVLGYGCVCARPMQAWGVGRGAHARSEV